MMIASRRRRPAAANRAMLIPPAFTDTLSSDLTRAISLWIRPETSRLASTTSFPIVGSSVTTGWRCDMTGDPFHADSDLLSPTLPSRRHRSAAYHRRARRPRRGRRPGRVQPNKVRREVWSARSLPYARTHRGERHVRHLHLRLAAVRDGAGRCGRGALQPGDTAA